MHGAPFHFLTSFSSDVSDFAGLGMIGAAPFFCFEVTSPDCAACFVAHVLSADLAQAIWRSPHSMKVTRLRYGSNVAGVAMGGLWRGEWWGLCLVIRKAQQFV